MEVLKVALIELGWILSVPILSACALWCANEIYYRSLGEHKSKVILLTGLVGVTAHEISHAIVATAFGLKVTNVVLFKSDPESKTLGYVNFNYNPNSFIHSLGLLFTGLSPLFVGALLVYFLFDMAGLPTLHSYFVLTDHRGLTSNIAMRSAYLWLQDIYLAIGTPIATLNIIISLMIGVHATPSLADLKGSIRGVSSVLIVIILYWCVTKFISDKSNALIEISIQSLNFVSTSILQLALISSAAALFMATIGVVINLIKPLYFGLTNKSG
ncbi:hypothetical protein [Pseudoalteromonas sp. TAB23]|uniref:hypothetical protein n=1 Tax=Pseudoalteromonas sp. TAB23 TaxID=1938595 RepID=UPI0011117F3B|nr:hypothetical protein [Pseudoalteromonas sp. TAB23]